MIDLGTSRSRPLAETVWCRSSSRWRSTGWARRGGGARAPRPADRRGPSSETYGILGRVYKDRWDGPRKAGDVPGARPARKAIDAYRRGFEADWRDAYPGVNAVTLMEIRSRPTRHPAAPRRLLCRRRKIAAGKPDYWDYATRLELAVLDRNEPAALKALGDALAHQRAGWEAETTLNNVRLITEARGDHKPGARLGAGDRDRA